MPAGHQLAEKVLRASPVVRLVDSDRMISVYSTRGNVVAQVEHRLAAACFGAPCDAVLWICAACRSGDPKACVLAHGGYLHLIAPFCHGFISTQEATAAYSARG